MPEHVDQQRRVGDGHHAHGILAGIDVPVPGIERRRKHRAFFPLQGDHVARVALPDLGPSLSGEDQDLLFENVAFRVGLASRRNLAHPRIDRPCGAFQENVGAQCAYPLPGFQLELVDVDETALVDWNAFFLEELPVGAEAVEDERVVVRIGPGPGGRGRLSRSPRGGNRSGGDSGQAHAQELRPGEPYFLDAVSGGLAVRMIPRGSRVSGVVGTIVGLVMRVPMTVVFAVMTGIGHRVLLESSL